MNKLVSMLFLMLGMSLFSQNKDIKSDEDEILTSFFDEDSEKSVDDLLEALFKEQKDLNDLMDSFSDFKFLYVSTNYTSNTYFAGRNLGFEGYNIQPQVSYITGKGFFASVSGAYFKDFDSKWNFTGLTAGYGKSFGKQNLFRYSLGYSRFIYAESGSNPYTNSTVANIGVRNKKRTLGARLSLNYSFGNVFKNDETILQSSLSLFGVVNVLNRKKYRLQLRPRLQLLAGEQIALFDTGATYIDIDTDGEEQLYIDYQEKEVFDLMNLQFSIPILLTTEKWDFEIGFHQNLPFTLGDEPSVENTNFVNLSIGYLLEL